MINRATELVVGHATGAETAAAAPPPRKLGGVSFVGFADSVSKAKKGNSSRISCTISIRKRGGGNSSRAKYDKCSNCSGK